MGHLYDLHDKWTFYKVYDEELPTRNELKRLSGIVIPGSHHAVHNDQLAWLGPLRELIRLVHKSYRNIKLLGIGFGHQIIAQALGGTVAPMKMDKPIAVH